MLNPYISFIAIILCFVPFGLLFWKRMNKEKVFLLVCIYWSITGLINMPQYLPVAYKSAKLEENVTLIDNMLDTPLMVLIFYYTSEGFMRNLLRWFLLSFVIFEAIMIFWKGHNYDSNTIIIGAGTILTFGYSVWRLAQYFQKMEHNDLENTMVFVYASYVFYFGIFLIIWVFNYLNFRKETVSENLFLYYLSIILATSVTSIGFWRYQTPSLSKVFQSRYRD
jgi:hypothetical protein